MSPVRVHVALGQKGVEVTQAEGRLSGRALTDVHSTSQGGGAGNGLQGERHLGCGRREQAFASRFQPAALQGAFRESKRVRHVILSNCFCRRSGFGSVAGGGLSSRSSARGSLELPLSRSFFFFRARTNIGMRQRVSVMSSGRGSIQRGVKRTSFWLWPGALAPKPPLGSARPAGVASPGGTILRAHGLPWATCEWSLDIRWSCSEIDITVEVDGRHVA